MVVCKARKPGSQAGLSKHPREGRRGNNSKTAKDHHPIEYLPVPDLYFARSCSPGYWYLHLTAQAVLLGNCSVLSLLPTSDPLPSPLSTLS